MNRLPPWRLEHLAAALAGLALLSAHPLLARASGQQLDDAHGRYGTTPVSGTGVHLFTTAIVHTQAPTPTGFVQTSTETVELEGDVKGRLLYHPTSIFDFSAGTLVNTGHQVFSGTVLGSAPVLLHDDDFRFEVDLTTGATTGQVYLARRIAGPPVRCRLEVVGTGMNSEGNATFTYTGYCKGSQESSDGAPS
jgi:hypothetical protein